jgi:hypothetical protein
MLELLTVMILMPNHMQLKVRWILLICNHLIMIQNTLVPFTECRDFAPVVNLVGYRNNSRYMYCVSAVDIIPQSCPSGTEVSFKLGGCVNKTSK